MASLSHQLPCRGRKNRTLNLYTTHVLKALVFICVIATAQCAEEYNDIQSLLNDDQPSIKDSNWNLPDTKAIVGKLFKYDLGLKQQSGKYKVKEISHDYLPTWLTYNVVSDQLEGVPSIDDLGEHNIALVPEDPLSGMVKHFFTIVVKKDHLPQQLLYSPMTERTKVWENCRSDDPVTMAKIILDADMPSLTGNDRAKILNNIINHLTVSPDFLRLHPLGDEPAYDKTALVAGPGNAQERQKPGVVLSWQIGCGSVDAENMAILEKVESSSRDGTMSDVIGHPIVGWSVTNNRPQAVALSRKKRAIQATPTIESSPPTKAANDRSDNDDYFGETEDGFSRNIPNMASPQQTRHSKRTKTAGRHMHNKSKNPNNKKYKTPMATPVMTPIVPTARVKYTSTVPGVVIQPSRSKMMYTTPSPGEPVSRTAVLVQPSMPSERPATTTSYTAPLPTPFYTQFPSMPSTSKPTESSSRTEIKPSQSKETIKPSKKPVAPVSPEPEKNKTPAPNKKVFKRIDGNFGRMINIKIPSDLFQDEEDGDTRNLKLMLLRDQMNVPRSHWLQLKEKQQILHGILLPPKPARGRAPKKVEYNYELAAIDSGGKIARTPLQVVMKRLPHINKINHEFAITIDFDYNIFKDNVINSVTVVNKIARLYGESNTDNIIITSLKRGSVIFSWTNASVEMAPCPALEINRLLSYIITDKKTLTQSFVDMMRPYRIKTAGARALGACQGLNFKASGENVGNDKDGTVYVRNNDDKTPYVVSPGTGQSEEKKPSDTSEDNLLITTVVPAVVIAAMILLAAIIACILYRKKRKGKLSDEDKHTFVNKGIPVIFADELEDKPDPPTKPLIMPEEKPPLPPPEYHRSGSIPPSPPSDHKDPIESTEDEHDYDDRDNSPPYQPPPPFTSGNVDHRQQRPRQVQMHRAPPPYVPP